MVALFGIQHMGTRCVSFRFAPVILTWLVCSTAVGVYNVIVWNPSIFKALNPYYMYYFFKQNGTEGWIALGGVLLSVTGLEAMYADLVHFSRTSIQVAFIAVVYPLLMVGYIGQAAYLSKNLDVAEHAFFSSVPELVYWPVFVIATLASIVSSQAVISATFSIINQCLALGCFPHVKVVHTSKDIHGQIYIPEINWMMLLLCLGLTIGFRDVVGISNAYGVAVITVMLVTTCLMTLVIFYVWQRRRLLAFAFLLVFGSVEVLYLTTAYYKVPQGGWVPLAISAVFMTVMYVWHFGTTKKDEFDVQNMLTMDQMFRVPGQYNLNYARVPGVGLIYTDLVNGVPRIFSHFITTLPAFHTVVVFVCIKSAPVPYVDDRDRYLIGRIDPRASHMYRCVVRYGYKDVRGDENDFEDKLLGNLEEFIKTGEPSLGNVDQTSYEGHQNTNPEVLQRQDMVDEASTSFMAMSQGGDTSPEISRESTPRRRVHFATPGSSSIVDDVWTRELAVLSAAKEWGPVSYLMSHSHIKAKQSSSLGKRLAINYAYTFLRKNCRDPSIACNLPHHTNSLIEVGMFSDV